MRSLVLEKTNQVNQSELELMLIQTTLLLTHAQVDL